MSSQSPARRLGRITATIGCVFAAVALSACASGESTSPEQQFADGMRPPETLMTDSLNTMQSAGQAILAGDFEHAIRQAHSAAAKYRDLFRLATDAPNATTQLGTLTTTAYGTCATANAANAASLEVDGDFREAIPQLQECVDQLMLAANLIEPYRHWRPNPS